MRFKNKQISTRCKSQKQPHWKELALLLSKKRQLNVVLSRDIIPTAKLVSSTSRTVASSAQNDSCNTNNPTENPRISLESYEEDIIRIKEEFIPPGPSRDAAPGNPARNSASSIKSEGFPLQSSHTNTLRPDSTEDANDTYNVSINDFQNLLMAATKRSDIRLSIEKTFFNFDDLDEQPNTKSNDSGPIVTKRPIKYKRLPPAKRKKQRILPQRILREKHHEFMLQKNQNNAEIHEQQTHQNNLPSADDNSTTQQTTQETIQNNAQKSQQNLTEQPRDLLILTLQKRPTGRPMKRKLNGEEKSDTGQEKNKRSKNTWKIKKGPKLSTRQTKEQDEQPLRHITDVNLNINENDKNPSDPEKNREQKEKKDHAQNTQASDKNTENVGQDPPEQNGNLSSSGFGKRPRGRPRKIRTQAENISEKTHQSNCGKRPRGRPPKTKWQNEKREKTCQEKSTQTELNKSETSEKECQTEQQRSAASVQKADRKKAGRRPKSVALELQLLRKGIIGVSKSQKQIQKTLQSKLDDRFDLFGKTIAACLRELPEYYSRLLEVKLMDVLVEEKRHLMTLTNGSDNNRLDAF